MTAAVDQQAKRARIETAMTKGNKEARKVPLDNKWYSLLPITVPLDIVTSPAQFVIVMSSLGDPVYDGRVGPLARVDATTNNWQK